jgi:hypothetical protein
MNQDSFSSQALSKISHPRFIIYAVSEYQID